VLTESVGGWPAWDEVPANNVDDWLLMQWHPPVETEGLESLCVDCVDNPRHEATEAHQRCIPCDHKHRRRYKLASIAVE